MVQLVGMTICGEGHDTVWGPTPWNHSSPIIWVVGAPAEVAAASDMDGQLVDEVPTYHRERRPEGPQRHVLKRFASAREVQTDALHTAVGHG